MKSINHENHSSDTGYKQTEVGVIPEDWDVRTIEEVCSVINGRGFKPHEWGTSGLPIIRIQNLNGSEDFNYYEGDFDPKIVVENGQLLFAWSGSRGTSFGPHMWFGGRALLNYHTWKIVPKGSIVVTPYFFQALRNLTSHIEDKAHGASALVHMQKWEMEQFHVLVPPVPEQQAISHALSNVDALIDSLDKLIAKKRDIKQAAMQQLLTRKRRLPGFGGKWEIARLGNIIEDGPRNGHSGSAVLDRRGTPTLRLTATTAGRFTLNDSTIKYLVETIPSTSDLFLRPGDVLIQRSNTIDLVGTTAIYDGPPNTYVYPDLMMRVRFHEYLAARWFVTYANSRMGRRFFVSAAAGSTGSMPKITGAALREMPVPVPEPEEQQAITDFLCDMDAEITALEARRDKTKLLKQGMMQVLLTGRIRLI